MSVEHKLVGSAILVFLIWTGLVWLFSRVMQVVSDELWEERE